ncbi:diacylglycerol kinase catalytic domain-containing protein [Toxoplasma gondii TgCatPRC2]|uniref:diacylglycerol kinase (ATP) n=1 Tax=Toxoplasma gondii TgCatPRC2 TaxID=1130821 RepID=A0A151HLW1_TOXGO|nr:diacylglycerol kinase catalytic domain-containing protein [Toxoplasma gondii TgCatPRC2]
MGALAAPALPLLPSRALPLSLRRLLVPLQLLSLVAVSSASTPSSSWHPTDNRRAVQSPGATGDADGSPVDAGLASLEQQPAVVDPAFLQNLLGEVDTTAASTAEKAAPLSEVLRSNVADEAEDKISPREASGRLVEAPTVEKTKPRAVEAEGEVNVSDKPTEESRERKLRFAPKPKIRAKFSPGATKVSVVEATQVAAQWPCRGKTRFVFLFVNRKAGGQAGARWLTGANRNGEDSHTLQDVCTRVLIYDLLANHSGFQFLREIVEVKRALSHKQKPTKKHELVRVIAVGGDGTVMWVNREAVAANVPIAWIAFGIVGFGTGNDFAQSYGWTHGNAQKLDIFRGDTLKRLVQMWQNAVVARHDTWRMSVSTYDGGYFEHVNCDTRTLERITDGETGLHARSFESPFILYLGIGFDALVGIEFDRLRSTSRLRNRIMYGVAFLKLLRRSWKRVTEQIDTVYVVDRGQKKVLFTTNTEKYPTAMRLESSISMTFLNNRSMIGGIPLWRHTTRVGVLPPAKDGETRTIYDTYRRRLINAHQSMGDSRIELIAFHGRFDLIRSVLVDYDAAGRLLQHRGPFLVSFYPEEQAGPVGFQTDGEFRIGHRIKSIYVEFVDSFNVLKNVAGHAVRG